MEERVRVAQTEQLPSVAQPLEESERRCAEAAHSALPVQPALTPQRATSLPEQGAGLDVAEQLAEVSTRPAACQ